MASFKLEANKLFKSGQWAAALQTYTHALAAPAARTEGSGLDHNMFTNRSECYLSLGDLENAIVDARVALLLKSDSAKAHYRLAKAVFLMGRVEEALSLVTNALQTHSTDMALLQLKNSCELRLENKPEFNPLYYLERAALYHDHGHAHAHDGDDEHSHSHDHHHSEGHYHGHSHSRDSGHSHSHDHAHTSNESHGHDHSHSHGHSHNHDHSLQAELEHSHAHGHEHNQSAQHHHLHTHSDAHKATHGLCH